MSPREAATPTQAAAPAERRGWVQEMSDLRADPEARFGVLPNGMRYVIKRNATPATEASLRLHFDVGSLDEAENERGVAHFLEHMVLNGTRNIPEGEFIRRLERAGLQFGPDTNASTTFDHTQYQLELPETDEATLDLALTAFRELAGEAALEAAAIDRERGIILSEERSRDVPILRAVRAQLGFLAKGTTLADRLPIGTPEVIRNAPRERFTSFYNRYYRPENATLIAVGDFDPEAIERKVRGLFTDWRGVGPAGRNGDAGTLDLQRGAETRVITEVGAPPSVSLSWVRPPETGRDDRTRRRRDEIERLGLLVLNRRFERLAQGQNPPFTSASASDISGLFKLLDATSVDAQINPAKWREALQAIDQEQRRLAQYGVGQAELNREIIERRSALTSRVQGAGTRRSPIVAAEMLNRVNENQVITTPAEELALFEEAVRGLTADQVNAAIRPLFSGAGPLAILTTPTTPEGGEAAFAQAFQQTRALAVAAPEVRQAKPWPYERFGTPGRVAERREAADLGTTFVRFENGVRLTVRPSQLRKDQVLVAARFGEGRLDLPRDRNTYWAAGDALVLGGLGKLTREELAETLAEPLYGASFSLTDNAAVLSGNTRPQDLDVQLQVLAAYATDPGLRPEALERARTSVLTQLDQLDSAPGGVLQRDLARLLRSGDRRWGIPSREEVTGPRWTMSGGC
jgi:zinc protease